MNFIRTIFKNWIKIIQDKEDNAWGFNKNRIPPKPVAPEGYVEQPSKYGIEPRPGMPKWFSDSGRNYVGIEPKPTAPKKPE
jgi:hypothetical protein